MKIRTTSGKGFSTKHIFFNLCLFALPFFSFAQPNDFEIWTEVEVRTEISERIRVSWANGIRFMDNATVMRSLYTEPGIQFRLNRVLSIDGSYRLKRSITNDYFYVPDHVFYFSSTARLNYGDWRLRYRTRLQGGYEGEFEEYTRYAPFWNHRNRLYLSYRNRSLPFEPHVLAEIYVPIELGAGYFVNRYRYAAGIDYELSNTHGFSLRYGLQQRVNRRNPRNGYFLSLDYTLTL